MSERKQDAPLKYLSDDEIEALFKVIPTVRNKALFRLIYHRGLRASEPGLLQMSDWFPETERLMVRRLKGSVSAPFRLTSIEARHLRAWIRERGSAAGPIFTSREHGPISRRQVWQLMHDYSKRAGIAIERAHPHALKHSCGTHVLEKLGDITLVQDWLGHKDIKSTAIYAKVVNPSREKAADRLRDWT